jgi:nucleoside-diphosphate-sugar epimerase
MGPRSAEGLAVLVAGGTGFVGRTLCARLAEAGADVAVVARSAPPSSPYRVHELDLAAADATTVTELLESERIDVVVDAVGSIWGLSKAEDTAAEEAAARACTAPGLTMLDAVRAAGRRPRLVHLGSVLEDPAPGADEPGTAYGRAKRAATEAVTAAALAGEVDAATLRIANVAGPGTPGGSLLGVVAGKLAAAHRTGDTATVTLTRMTAHRDYVHVADVADAVLAAVTVPALDPPGAVVDIGSGEPVAVRALVDMLITESAVPVQIEEIGDRPGGHPVLTAVDTAPAERLLGWRPQRTARDAVRDLWNEVSAEAPRTESAAR